MSLNIRYSSRLMDNYVQYQEEIIDNDARFEALQTHEGHTLFFSLSKEGLFYLIQEKNFHETGWEKTNLTEQIKERCFNNAQTANIINFDVRQNEKTGTIHAAAILNVDGKDHLVQAMGINNQDAVWEKPLAWQIIDFDDHGHVDPVVMKDVFVSYAADTTWAVVDILRHPSDEVPLVKRYYIDRAGHQKWKLHDVSVDIEAGKCTNKIGRIKGEDGDGIYTLGYLQGEQQLIYHPLFNYDFPDLSPNPTRLYVEGQNIQAFALTSLQQDAHTDIFAIGGNALYFFSTDNQDDSSVGTKLLEDDIFNDTKSLYAQSDGKQVMVWGLTTAGKVYYTACPLSQIEENNAWSTPLPIVDGAHQIAPYLNTTNSGNTFFAHTGTNKLVKLEQAPSTTLWTEDPIMLKTDKKTKAIKIKSFTTEITVTDEDNQPLVKEDIWLSTAARGSFLINGEYVVLDERKQKVRTNAFGNIAIIEMVEDIKGETIMVHDGSTTVEIDPTQDAVKKITSLDTPDKLKNATVDDGKGNKSSLLNADTSTADLNSVATALKELGTVGKEQALNLKFSPKALDEANLVPIASFNYVNPDISSAHLLATDDTLPKGVLKNIWTSVGDGLRYIGHAIKKVAMATFKVLKDTATGIYNIACTIGETVINFVVTAAKAVAKVCVKIFEIIKTAAEKVWNFLKFLFNWGDIKRTKEVLVKSIEMGMDFTIAKIITTKDDVHAMIQGLRDDMLTLAQKLEETQAVKAIDGPKNPKDDPHVAAANSSEGSFFKNHFNNNIDKIDRDKPNPDELNYAVDAIALPIINEGVIMKIINIFEEAKDQILSGTFNTNKILSKMLLLLDSVIEMIQNGMDFVFDMIITGLETVFNLLTEPIHIPVLSDILEECFGLPSFSLLDIICYIGAVPATIVYKIMTGKAPFEANDPNLQKLLSYKRTLKGALDAMATPAIASSAPREGQLGLPDNSGKVAFKALDLSTYHESLAFVNKLDFEFKFRLYTMLGLGKTFLQGVSDIIQDFNLAAVGAQAKAGQGGAYLQLIKKPMAIAAGPIVLEIASAMLFSVDYQYKEPYKTTSSYIRYAGWGIAFLEMVVSARGICPNRVDCFKVSYCLKTLAGAFNSLVSPIVNLCNLQPAVSAKSTTTIVFKNTNAMLAYLKVLMGMAILYKPESSDKLIPATFIVTGVKTVTNLIGIIAFNNLTENDFILNHSGGDDIELIQF